MIRELRYALRQFMKSPLVFGIVVCTLAVGIGANTAIFAIVDALMLRSLPVERPQELAWITNTGAYGTEAYSPAALFHAYRENTQIPATLFAFKGPQRFELRDGLTSATAESELVSGNYFAALGVRPALGRLLTAEDEKSSAPVVVLGHDYWKRAFHGDDGVVGRSIAIQGQAYTVAGVAPKEFFGTVVGNSPDIYIPLPSSGPLATSDLVMMGRLRPGTTLPQLQAALEPDFQRVFGARVARVAAVLPSIAPLMQQLFTRPLALDASHGISQLRVRMELPVRILMSVVGVVLLIGCINLASLLMMRGMRRRKELALKLALGASRWDMARGVVAETMLMVAAGGALGLLVAFALLKMLSASIATEAIPGVTHIAPIALSAGLSVRVLLFTFLMLGLTVVVCGIAPALLSTRLASSGDLKVNGHSLSRKGSRFGQGLAIAQITALVVLLFGASMLLRSFRGLETSNVGFDAEHTAVITMKDAASSTSQKDTSGYEQRLANFETQFAERAMGVAGIESVAFMNAPPMSGAEGAPVDVVAAEQANPATLHPDVFYAWVSPGYFRTMQIPMLAGRELDAGDLTAGAVKNVVINRTLARRLFANDDAVGRRFRIPLTGQTFEVIGIAEDTRFHDLREQAVPLYYSAVRKDRVIVARGSGSAAALVGSLRQLATSVDGSVEIESVKTMREQIGRSLYRDRLVARFSGAFGLLAVLFACLGIYGTLAFEVGQRTSEIGVRMAMGATARGIFEMIVGRGLRFSVAGLALGGAVAAVVTFAFKGLLFGADAYNGYKPGATGAENFIHIEKGFLFGVRPWDPVTLVAVAALVMGVCVLAAYLPARKASGVNPTEALRAE